MATRKRLAIIRGGVVENLIVIDDLAILDTSPWRAALAGSSAVVVKANQTAGPGWSYDGNRSPEFLPPDQPGDADDVTG